MNLKTSNFHDAFKDRHFDTTLLANVLKDAFSLHIREALCSHNGRGVFRESLKGSKTRNEILGKRSMAVAVPRENTQPMPNMFVQSLQHFQTHIWISVYYCTTTSRYIGK